VEKELHGGFIDRFPCVPSLVSCFLSHFLCAALEKDMRICFGDKENGKDG
jgi:hypothetical protein